MDPRLLLAVEASLAWYDDVFALHDIATRTEGGLWRALAPPPPLHSAAKTLTPGVAAADVLAAVSSYDACSVADSFAELDLAADGFALLFEATWIHHPPLAAEQATTWPPGWSRVTDPDTLATWVGLHDGDGIFLPGVLDRPAFSLLARHDPAGVMTAGAVLHDGRGAVTTSNFFGDPTWAEVLALVAVLHPGRDVTDYTAGADLDAALAHGFTALGHQRVWLR